MLTETQLTEIAVHEVVAQFHDAYRCQLDAAMWTETIRSAADVVTVTARHWIAHETHAPTLAEFVSACHAEDRHRVEEQRSRTMPEPVPLGEAKRLAQQGMKVVRQALAESWDSARTLQALTEAGVIAGPARLVACRTCSDERWLTTGSGVKPCPACEPESHERWIEHWRHGFKHRCEGCRPQKVGR